MRHYKYTIEIDLSEFSDWDLFDFNKGYTLDEAIYESIISWETPVYYDTEYYLNEYRDTAIKYLNNKGITEKEIKLYCDHDTLEFDILRACSDSWRRDVESNIYELYSDKIKNPGFDYSGFEYINQKSEVTIYWYEATSIRYGFTEKLWRELIYNTTELRYRDTLAYMRDDAETNLYDYAIDNLQKLSTGRYGDFESIENWVDIDKNFIALFSDYNEVEGEIKKNRKEKQHKIKGMIKNHVNLEKRQSFINSMEYRP